jgi:Predicted transcriptional regulators
MNLGLTYVQAKIYLSLAKLGVADTKSVAKSSGVARQDIYRIMSSLEVIGLMERSITKNLKYKATPTKEGLPLLLDRKKTSVLDAEKQMRKFLSSFSGSPNRAEFEETNFTIVYESTLFTKKQRALCMSAKHTIEFVVPVNICHDMSIVQIDCLREATG